MGQTLTKMVQSLKNVVHPLPPPPLQAYMTFPGKRSGQISSLLAPTAFSLKVKSLAIQPLVMLVFALEMLPGMRPYPPPYETLSVMIENVCGLRKSMK